MKRLIHLILILVFLCGCIDEVTDSTDRFVKIFGKEQSSFGNKLYQLPNGDILIAGTIGNAPFDITSVGEQVTPGESEIRTPGLIWADQGGNLKYMQSFAYDQVQTVPGIDITGLEDRAEFLDLEVADNGDIIVIGQWTQIIAEVDNGSGDITYENVSFPFYSKISSNFEFLSTHQYMGEPGWDGVLRFTPLMSKLDDGSVALISGVVSESIGLPLPTGYSYTNINVNLDTIATDRTTDLTQAKFIRGFDIDRNNNFVGIGTLGGNLAVFRTPISSMNGSLQIDEQSYIVDTDGVNREGTNQNPMYVFHVEEGGYVLIYPRPNTEVIFTYLTEDFQPRSTPVRIEVDGDNTLEYPRAAIRLSNGDFVLYNAHLVDNSYVVNGFLYRITLDGEIVFRMSIEGAPGDVIESQDGNLLVLSNPVYNGQLTKTTLTKMSIDGKLY